MIPGQIIPAAEPVEINAGLPVTTVDVTNTGDVAIHLTAHFHVFEANPRLSFNRRNAWGMRLDVPATGSVRIEPGETKSIDLVPIGGRRHVYGFNNAVNGSLPEVYLLQLRAEAATPIVDDDMNECTTFAVQPEATANGIGLVGQNADLPAFYRDISITAEIRADDQPAVLMILPAGQVSYIGINDRGLGVFANFVTCDGWRKGFPRYFLSRLALTESTVDGAIERVRSVPRASSRNLIMLDAQGVAADLETTPTRDARLDPDNGLLAHSNHYVHESLHDEERSPAKSVANSRIRLQQMQTLLAEQRGQLDAERMQAIMRDRTCYPDTLCRMPGDDPDSDMITFASVIAEPSEGRMWVAVGPPNENPYVPLAFSS